MTSEEGQAWRLVTENYAPYFKAPNGLLVALEAMPVHLNVLEAAARDRETLEARIRELDRGLRDTTYVFHVVANHRGTVHACEIARCAANCALLSQDAAE